MNDLYNKIQQAHDKFFPTVAARIIRESPDYYYFPGIILAAAIPGKMSFGQVNIPSAQFKGESVKPLLEKLSNELYLELADVYTPENLLYRVFIKQPDVDGDEGCEQGVFYFTKIGRALRYITHLLSTFGKPRTPDFPGTERGYSRHYSEGGAYARSVVIEKLEVNK